MHSAVLISWVNMYTFQYLCIHTDVMPSVEDMMVLLNLPILEYLLYPHLRKTMGLKVKPIHKVNASDVDIAEHAKI